MTWRQDPEVREEASECLQELEEKRGRLSIEELRDMCQHLAQNLTTSEKVGHRIKED